MVEKSSRQYIEEIKSIRRQMAYAEQQKSEYLETIEKLSSSEKMFRDLAENDPDWTFWLSEDDRLVYISSSSKRITGYEPDDFKKDAKLLFKIIHPEDRTTFDEHLRFAHKSKTYTEDEFRIIRKDKKMRWISQITQPAYDAEGGYAGLITSNRDITDSKSKDDSSRDSEIGYQLLAENMNDVIWILDPTLRPTYISPSVQQMLGYTVEEAMDQNLRVTLTAASLPKFNEVWSSEILSDRSGKSNRPSSATLPLQLRCKDGSTVWAESRFIPLRNDDKKIVETILVCRNISESYEAREKLIAAEKKLRQNEDQIKTLLGAATESLCLTDTAGHVLLANETAARRLGINLAALSAGSNLYDFLPPDIGARYKQYFQQAQKFNKPVIFQEELSGRTIANTIYPAAGEDGKVSSLVIFGMDITDRLSAESAAEESMHGLVESERLKKMLVSAAPVRIYWKDRRSVYLGCNSLYALDAGREKPEDLIGETDKNLIWREQADHIREEDIAVMGGKTSILNREEKRTAPGGKTIWLRTTKVPLTDTEGRVIGVIGAYEDITEYKKSLERLAAAEQKSIDHTRQLEDISHRLLESERQAQDLRKQLLESERNFTESQTRSADNEKQLLEYQTRLKELEKQLAEIRDRLTHSNQNLQETRTLLQEKEKQLQSQQAQRKEQEKQILQNQSGLQEMERQLGKTTYQLRESEKQAETYQNNLTDAQDQLQKTQTWLKTSESQMQALLDTSTESIFLIEPDGKIAYANETTARRLKTDLPKLLAARSMFDFLPPDTVKNTKKHVNTVLQTGKPVRFEDERSGITFLNSIYPVITEDGSIIQLAVSSMDISDRKKAEKTVLNTSDQIQAANRMLHLVIDALPVRVFWKDKNCVYLGANQLFARDMGKEHPENLIGRKDEEFMPTKQAQQHRQDDTSIMTSGQPKTDYEELSIMPGGKKNWLRISKIPLTDTTGQIIGVLGIYDDITDQKKAAEELAESEKRYRSIFENNHMPMLLIDPAGGAIVDANPAACSYYGWTHEELTAKGISDINTLPLRDISKNLNLAASQKRNHFIFKHRRADGSTRDVEVFSGPILFHGKSYLYSIIYDITDRIQMEQTLRQTEKLDSLGILAGGIAHDFNNLMTIVQGHIDVALLQLSEDHLASQSLQAAQDAVEKTRDITGRLITFSRGGSPLVIISRIEKLIGEAVKHSLKSSNIQISMPSAADLWPAEVDRNQIKQCFCHLVDNAREAMPDGGSLSISAENVYITEADALPLVEGPYLKILFQDSGTGISADHIARIFDPYYSTKPMSKDKGMGLGLAVCHSVLKKHGGYITVSSEQENGATFILYLPAKPGAMVEETLEILEPEPASMRILIMDDNADIRRILQVYLEKLGFVVVAVAEGQETIRQYREAKETDDPFAAVFMEISVKQGLGGEATLTRLKNIDPDVKAVAILSEHSDSRSQKFLDLGFDNVLGKPFRLEDMKNILKSLLEA